MVKFSRVMLLGAALVSGSVFAAAECKTHNNEKACAADAVCSWTKGVCGPKATTGEKKVTAPTATPTPAAAPKGGAHEGHDEFGDSADE